MSERHEDTSRLLLRGGTLYTVDARHTVLRGDLLISGGRIAAMGEISDADAAGARVLDARNCVVLPGFVQTHLHLCQTLFRGLAENRELTRWLEERIWPLEAAHTPETLRAAARVGIAELLLGGTTCIHDMGTVHHQPAIFDAILESGIRAAAGKAMMDVGDAVPAGLREDTDASLRESLDLLARWHGADDDRIRYAFAPRFVLSASKPLWQQVEAESQRTGAGIHSHAAESTRECDLVESAVGCGAVEYFHRIGVLSERLRLAHAVWIGEDDRARIARSGTHLVHCPSSNLKLSSGIADVWSMRRAGINLSLGADGAACNNTLDMFQEMRLAGQLATYLHGPGTLPSRDILEMATRGGARALAWDRDIGSLETGKRADVIVVRLDAPHVLPGEGDGASLADTVVYACRASDVAHVMVAGRLLVEGGRLIHGDWTSLRDDAVRARADILPRAQLPTE